MSRSEPPRIAEELRPRLVFGALVIAVLAAAASVEPAGPGPVTGLMTGGIWWTLRAALRRNPSADNAVREWGLSAIGMIPSVLIAMWSGGQADALSICVLVAVGAGAATAHRLATLGQRVTGICTGVAFSGALALLALRATTIGPEHAVIAGLEVPTLGLAAGAAGALITLALWHSRHALSATLALAWGAGAGLAQTLDLATGWTAVATGAAFVALVAPGHAEALRTCASVLAIATIALWFGDAETIPSAKAGVLSAIALTLGRELAISTMLGRIAPKAGHILILAWALATWGIIGPALVNAGYPLLLAGLSAPPWNVQCTNDTCATALMIAGTANATIAVWLLVVTRPTTEAAPIAHAETARRGVQERIAEIEHARPKPKRVGDEHDASNTT